MSYYGMGDYYRVGDPGLFSSIGSFARKAVGVGVGFATGGPVGAAATLLGRPTMTLGGGTRVTPSAALPGGAPFIQGRRKRRRMNVTNDKALKRAIRRQEGFVKLARKSLKGTGYKIVSASAGRSKPRVVNVREHGPGGVRVG